MPRFRRSNTPGDDDKKGGFMPIRIVVHLFDEHVSAFNAVPIYFTLLPVQPQFVWRTSDGQIQAQIGSAQLTRWHISAVCRKFLITPRASTSG